ncbi:hypothetical protein PVAP13_9KG217785 [Panicum virgatum]|uniref:Uncharacterized protein n=1 Tax=Panicum virgatum TaxID=38727 RepID=A0A8T0NHE4_PANVG|nr:hypothetical protein PVAP13_9KG217785 [Panicum virgatum]
MAASLEDLATKFQSFEAMLQKTLDKVSDFDSWKTMADASLHELLTKTDDTALRLHRLEVAPPPQPPRAFRTQFPLPPGGGVSLDLDMAPPGVACPSASTSEQPSGHRQDHGHRNAGGGILGSHPPHPVTGMFPQPSSHPIESHMNQNYSAPRTGPLPKFEVPRFDGENPRLWKDRCEMYFEVYGVSDALKPHFAALNFSGAAASWL